MAEDPGLPLTDVQFVLGHAQLTTTQIYLTPRKEDVIRRVLAHHAEQTRRAAERVTPRPGARLPAGDLAVLFGNRPLVTATVERRGAAVPAAGRSADRPRKAARSASRPGTVPETGRPPARAASRRCERLTRAPFALDNAGSQNDVAAG